MHPVRFCMFVVSLFVLLNSFLFAAPEAEVDATLKPLEPSVGSWTFSGTVTNENGERFGYFFQVQRQGIDFHTKTALIDAQQNKLVLFYEADDKIKDTTELNWHIGKSFVRYNPINDSWVFGVKTENKKGFNFKVDMLKGLNNDHDTIALRPGVELQAFQTSQLNGHMDLGDGGNEQFVTAKKAWFGKLWMSKEQRDSHEISTTFCGLNNDNGFFSANLKEADATTAAIAGWRDPGGNKVKMSQFVSLKSVDDNQCLLNVSLPKLSLKLYNTLNVGDNKTRSVAGFSKSGQKGFCVVTAQSFKKQEMDKA